MNNFSFLKREFATLHKAAAGAEKLFHSDPRAACMRIRHALERALHWLYDYDRSLHRRTDRGLNGIGADAIAGVSARCRRSSNC